MSKKAFLPIFNSNLMTFLDTLSKTFPDSPHFKRASVAVSSILIIDAEIPLLQFVSHVSPHREQVLNCDSDFFLSKSSDSFVAGSDNTTDIIEYLKNLWLGITDSNRKVIWNWLHVLIKISDKCV